MKQLMLLIVLVLNFGPSAVAAEGNEICPPQPPWTHPVIPDGAVATEEEMKAAQLGVVKYVGEIEHWNNCNDYINGLLSGRMLFRAREFANAYNSELRTYLGRDPG